MVFDMQRKFELGIRIGKRFSIKKRLTAGLLGVALLTAGCGGNGGPGTGFSKPGGNMAGSQAGDQQPVMGRYVEQEFPYEENNRMEIAAALVREAEGFYLLDGYGKDARITLEGSDLLGGELPQIANVPSDAIPDPLRRRIKKDEYITQIAMSEAQSRMYTIFVLRKENPEDYCYEKYFLTPEGKENRWDANGSVGTDEDVRYFVGDDGCFYVLTMRENQRVYRVDGRSGETEYLMEFAGGEEQICNMNVFGGKLYADTYERIRIFDLDTLEEAKEDKELNELLKGKFGGSVSEYGGTYLLCKGENDSLYVATSKGLFRHVLYGNVSEMIIDGSLCSLGDVSKYFTDMYVEQSDANGTPVFYFLYSNGKMVRFAYDPDMPATPEKMITLYSLCENRDIRLAISAYQAEHKDIYLSYEVGMSGQDGVTREDALKNLATRIAAGEGPDIFVLDDLPYRAYVERGILLDMSALYGDLKKEQNYFDNVVQAFYTKDKLYALPMMFSVPLIVGKTEALKNITDEESLVRAVENAHVSDKSFRAGLMDAGNVLFCMSYTDSTGWLTEDGSLDKIALREYLNRCVRLYKADRADISEQNLSSRQILGNVLSTELVTRDDYWQDRQINSVTMEQIVFREPYSIGTQGGDVYGSLNLFYANLQALDMDYKLMPGRGKVCLPHHMLGISSSTAMQEEAMDFVKYALSDYLKEADQITGIPINRDVWIAMEQNPDNSYEPYLFYMTAFDAPDEEGKLDAVDIDVAWQKPEVYERYNAMLDSLDTVNLCELELLNAVTEQGVPALTGEKTVEEAVDAIAKKVQIYLAE